jgi:hypothetical protein
MSLSSTDVRCNKGENNNKIAEKTRTGNNTTAELSQGNQTLQVLLVSDGTG